MQRPQVSRRWTGHYDYDPMSGPCAVQRVRFTLDIASEENLRFLGSVQDDPAAGMPEAGTIEAAVSGEGVVFVKRMPALYMFDAGRIRHIAECVRDWWGLELDGVVPSPAIHYEGTFKSNGMELTGWWWANTDTLAIPCCGKQYALDIGRSWGVWHATKQPSET